MGRRAFIQVCVEVDLDAVPGAFNKPGDWVNYMLADVMRQSHYNVEFKMASADVVYKWDGSRPERTVWMTSDAVEGRVDRDREPLEV